MRIYNKIGSKERLFEMFENVNKMKLNESFDSPEKKDKKYLEKSVGDDESNVSKYDDGVRYPVEKELKVDDESLKGLKGDDAPLEESWDNDYVTPKSERGKYKGKSLEELRKMLSNLKKSGPHEEGSPEYEKQNELEFAIRAKTGWGKVSEHSLDNQDIADENIGNNNLDDEDLLDPSVYWVNDYVPKNVGENINYPNPLADPETGEDQYDEMQKIKRFDNLFNVSKKLAEIYNSGNKNRTLEYIRSLDEIPMIGSARGGDLGLGHRDLESLGLIRVVRHDDDSYIDNEYDKPIVILDTRRSTILSEIKPNKREYI